MDQPYFASQDPGDPDVIHFFETNFSDDPGDWVYAGYGEVPGDLTFAEWAEMFEDGVGPQPEDFVPAGEGDSDGGDGEGGGGGEGGDDDDGEDDGEDGGDGGEDGEGGGRGEGGRDDGEGEHGGTPPAGGGGAGEPLADSQVQTCQGLMDDYRSLIEDLTDALGSGETDGDDAAAEAQGLGEAITALVGELAERAAEALASGEAAARTGLLVDQATSSLGAAAGLGGGLGEVPSPSTSQLDEPPDLAEEGGEPVRLSSGAFAHEARDVLISGVGLDIDVTRHYSNQIYHSGSFGPKWDVWFDARIRKLASGNLYLWSGAARGEFHGVVDGANSYEAPLGCRHQVRRTALGWDVSDRLGTVWRFAADGWISEKRDRFGNLVEVLRDDDGRPTALRDGNGRRLDVSTGPSGRVQRIQDWAGRVWTYGYAGDRLVSVSHPATEDQPSGRTVRYAYVDGADPRTRAELEVVTNPLGVPLVTNTYGQAGDGFNRVTAQTYTGDQHRFAYEVIAPDVEPVSSNRHVVSHRTVHTDARGIDHVHDFNVFGCLLSARTESIGLHADNPGGWETGLRYDVELNNEEIRLPGGSRLRFRYDTAAADPLARHDVLEARHDPTGGSTPAVHAYRYGPFGQLSSLRDPLDATITLTRDALGRATTFTGPECRLADGTTQVIEVGARYNERGQLTRVTTGEGVVYEFAYVESGGRRGLPTQTQRDGTVIEAFEFDELWRLVAFTDEAGNEFRLEWDAADRVVRERAPETTGAERRYGYDAAGGLVLAGERVAAPGTAGAVEFADVTYERDERGRLVRATRPIDAGEDAVTRFEWDEDDRLVGLTDAEGRTSRWEWDERGLPVRRRHAVGTAREAQEHFRHDLDGLLVEQVDANGNVTTVGYDPLLRPAALVDPLGTTTRFGFDRCGHLTEVELVDVDGVPRESIAYTPDPLGRVRSVEQRIIDVDGSAVGTLTNQLLYDRHGRPTALVDTVGRRYELAWDVADQLTSVVDPAGNATRFAYGPGGGLTEMVAAGTSDAGLTTVIAHRFAYDELGRIAEAGDALGNTDKILRDPRGLVTRYQPAGGIAEELGYDLAGRLTARSRSRVASTGATLGTVTETVRYDRTGRPIEIDDGRSDGVVIQYDAAGDVARVQMSGATRMEATSDAAGNPVTVVDGRGTRVDISYDGLHRETARRVVTAAGAEGPVLETFGYDATGNLVLAENGSHTISRAFDSLGRLRSETVDGRTLTRTYNPDGTPRDLVYPSGFRVRAGWDEAYRPRRLDVVATGSGFPGPAGISGTLLGWDYAVDLLPSSLTTTPGAVHRFSYDAAGRDLEVALIDTAGAADRLVSLRNGFGRPQHRIRSDLTSVAGRHDSLGWLDRVMAGPAVPVPDLDPWRPGEAPDGTGPTGDQAQLDALIDSLTPDAADVTRSDSYDYDGAGNRVRQARVLDGRAEQHTWTFDAANRLVAVDAETVESDGAGHLVTDGVHRYHYDYLGRLVRIEDAVTGGDLVVLGRDALGRVLSVDAGGQQRRRSYAGDDVIEERDGSDVLTRLVVPGSRIDQPFVVFQDGGAFYAHQDAVGSILAFSDAAGRLVERYLRDEFGQLLASFDGAGNVLTSPTIDQPFGFQGREAWTETPLLIDFRSRAYRADWGRFLQPDPLGLAGGLNPYLFVANDPLLYVDPYGEFFFLGIAAGALIGGGIAAWFNRDKKGKDFAVAVLAGAVGGGLAGVGGLGAFIAGGAVSGGIMGGYEGYRVGGAQGAVIGGTFGGAFGALAGGLGGYAGQRAATLTTGWVNQALAGRLSGQVAYAIGSYAGAGLGGGVGGGLAGGTSGFGQGVGVSFAAGLDVETALRNGAGATLPGAAYGALSGVGAGVGTKALMQAGGYARTRSYSGVIGEEAEYFVARSIGQRLNRAWSTPQGKVPDFWGTIRGEVKNTAKVPTLGARGGQLRSFLDAAGSEGEVLHLFTRPGVRPPVRGQVAAQAAAGTVLLRTIPHWAYPALTTATIGC